MRAHDRVNILLVDDQPSKLLSYEVMLGQLGENLIKASSAREALEHLLRTEITVVVTDVSMPEMDGFELAEIIRQHPRYEKTAILFVSAVHLTDLDRLKGYESGAVDYVAVPIVPELLRAKVRVFVDLYRKTRDLERLNRELEVRVVERTAELETAVAKQVDLANRLREADRRKDEFLALLGHELRNPLAPVRNAVHILRLRQDLDADLAWCRDVIERQAGQLARLVDELLDVSRISQWKIQLRLEPLDLATVVAAAVETSRPLIDEKEHELVVTLPEVPLRLEGDPARLIQVVANLLNNAAKFQEARGRIELAVERVGDEAVIRVRDRGFGVAPEMLHRIFELFSQGERVPDYSQGGLGVGLSLVKTLVEMHGGSAEVRSEGLGRGAEAIVRLPCLPAWVDERGRAARRLEVPEMAPRRILVVDDNHDAAESLAKLLRAGGHQVRVAADGAQALAIAVAEQPAVVLLDICLPGMDGYEVCLRLREQGLAEAQIIAMTGFGQERDRRRSKEAGFDTHLVKPVEIVELMRLLAAR